MSPSQEIHFAMFSDNPEFDSNSHTTIYNSHGNDFETVATKIRTLWATRFEYVISFRLNTEHCKWSQSA